MNENDLLETTRLEYELSLLLIRSRELLEAFHVAIFSRGCLNRQQELRIFAAKFNIVGVNKQYTNATCTTELGRLSLKEITIIKYFIKFWIRLRIFEAKFNIGRE